MIILNFSHPLTDEQLETIKQLTGEVISQVENLPVSFDHQRLFTDQVEELMARCPLSSEEWQTKRILIVPPSLNFIAATLIAALHGRMGYFPPIVRLKPLEGAVPPQFEVAEIIDLQSVRDRARRERMK